MNKEKKTFKDRVKNPVFLAAAAGYVYTMYNLAATQNGYPQLDQGLFRMGVDLGAYLLIGTGIYSSFDNKK